MQQENKCSACQFWHLGLKNADRKGRLKAGAERSQKSVLQQAWLLPLMHISLQ
jgi:hypothetical protein